MPPDEKAGIGAKPMLLPQLDRYRFALLGLAFASWGITYITVAFSAWDHNLSFVKAIAAGNLIFLWALGLFGWFEFQHSIRRSIEPGRFAGRAKRYSPKKYLFSLAFFVGYAAGALIVAPYVCLRIAFS